MLVGGRDLPEDANWLDDFGIRGLAVDTDSGEGGQQVMTGIQLFTALYSLVQLGTAVYSMLSLLYSLVVAF
jgi:hypothetical protein